MANQRLNIDIVANDKSKQAFNSLQGNIGKTQSTLLSLKNILLAVAGSVVIRQFFQLSNEFQNLQNKLRTVVKSSTEFKIVQNELFKIAQRTNAGFSNTVETFKSLAQETDNLSLSNKELLQLTENINKLIRVSGVSADRAGTAIFQLSQAFSLGELQGNDFKILTKSLPALLDLLSSSLGVSKEQLKKMAKEGKITGDILFDTITKSTKSIDRLNDAVVTTLSESVSNMGNSFLNLVGQINEVSGASGFLTRQITNLSKALDEMSKEENLPSTVFNLLGGINSPIFSALGAKVTKMKIDAIKNERALLIRESRISSQFLKELDKSTGTGGGKKLGVFIDNNRGEKNRLLQLHLNEDIKVTKKLQIDILEKLKLQNKEYSLSSEIFGMLNTTVSSFSRSFAEAVIMGKSLNMTFKEFAQSIMVEILAKLIEKLTLMSIENLLTDFKLKKEKEVTAEKQRQLKLQRDQNKAQGVSMLMSGNPLGFLGFMASGGAVAKGQSYMVGERGPELFTPNQTGQISQSARGNNAGSTTVNFNINTVDASGFNDLLIRSRGTITQLINNAVNERGSRNII